MKKDPGCASVPVPSNPLYPLLPVPCPPRQGGAGGERIEYSPYVAISTPHGTTWHSS